MDSASPRTAQAASRTDKKLCFADFFNQGEKTCAFSLEKSFSLNSFADKLENKIRFWFFNSTSILVVHFSAQLALQWRHMILFAGEDLKRLQYV